MVLETPVPKKYFDDPHSLSYQYIFFHSLVYTLWKFPVLLLSFTTWPPVLEKLKGGAGVCIVGLSDLRFYLYAAFYP